jgi:hypothetical protein
MTEAQAARPPQRRRSRAEANELAAEFEASGLTRQEFCDRKNVPMKTLARYVARHRGEQGDADGAQRWVAVEVAEPRGPGAELVLILAGGRRIEVKPGFDSGTLRQVVTVLEGV